LLRQISVLKAGKKTEGVDPERYEAAKTLSAGLNKRLLTMQRELQQERARVRSAVKLIHRFESKNGKAAAPVVTEGKDEKGAAAPAKAQVLTEGKKPDAAPATEESRDLEKRIAASTKAGADGAAPKAPAAVTESTLMTRTVKRCGLQATK